MFCTRKVVFFFRWPYHSAIENFRAVITTLNIVQKLLPFFSVPAYYGRFLGLFVLLAISWRTFLAHKGQKLRLFRLRFPLR